MPGRVATFCSCSSARSAMIASSSSRSAKTRAGTRMSARDAAGISQSVSSSCTSSDVEDDAAVPDTSFVVEPEPVERDALHEWARRPAVPGDRRLQTLVFTFDRCDVSRDELLDFREEEKLVQPVDEQERAVATRQLDLDLRRLSVLASCHELCEGVERGGEDSDLALSRELDLDFAAVFDEVMFRLDMSKWRHVATIGDTSPCLLYTSDAA